jgi:hypothetical protein
MKVLGKATLTLGLMIILSLLLTSCSGGGLVTPELQLDPEEELNTVILETAIGNLGNQEPTEEPETENPQKWFGLTGFVEWYGSVEGSMDTWLDNGFNEIRDLRDYQDTTNVDGSKAAVLAANAKGLKFIWGVSSNSFNNPDYTITSTNWLDFRAAILDAAQWAQDNGVYEFQLGNEEELHIDGTTMTITGIITNLKSVATDAQEIFTNGNVSYSCWQGSIDDWITAGKGDIDVLASNVYIGGEGYYSGNEWKTRITNLVDAFGVDGTYITEFAPSYSSLEDYSADEAVQAAGVTEMIEYMKASGIKRALFYSWHDYPGGLFGVVKDDGTYRLLWSQALINTEPVKFATVPSKTTTASLPDTIALLPKITR